MSQLGIGLGLEKFLFLAGRPGGDYSFWQEPEPPRI